VKITLVQPDIIWENKSKNLEKLSQLISTISQATEIIILPEMFNTGFMVTPDDIFELPDSETLEWMKSISKKYNAGICGSYIVKENIYFYNRWIFISPDDEMWSYDKRHLFSPGGEDKMFTRGIDRIVFNFRGIRICPSICYDLRFPVWIRNRNDYDLLINSANWPESRRDVWITLLKARALENQCFVAGANRVGIDGTGIKYCGDSVIVGPKGEIMAESRINEEGIITGDISIRDLSDFRNNFPVLNDADEFTIH
jgi:predicted amidohydrolase